MSGWWLETGEEDHEQQQGEAEEDEATVDEATISAPGETISVCSRSK